MTRRHKAIVRHGASGGRSRQGGLSRHSDGQPCACPARAASGFSWRPSSRDLVLASCSRSRSARQRRGYDCRSRAPRMELEAKSLALIHGMTRHTLMESFFAPATLRECRPAASASGFPAARLWMPAHGQSFLRMPRTSVAHHADQAMASRSCSGAQGPFPRQGN